MRITKRDREILRELGRQYLDLKYDYRRRLRNALYALTQMDPRWMLWVERELNPRWGVERTMRAVEARAKVLVMQRFKHMGFNRSFYYFNDTPFSDAGALLPG